MPKKEKRKPLKDTAIKRQVQLERLKTAEAISFNEVFEDIQKTAQGMIADLSDDLTAGSARELEKWLQELEKKVARHMASHTKLYVGDLQETAGLYAGLEAGDISKSIGGDTLVIGPDGTFKHKGVTFKAPSKHKVVLIDVNKFDKHLKKTPELYVGPGGTGAAIGKRYEKFKDFLKTTKDPITPSYVTSRGFIDGRHRFAVFRDKGWDTVPVMMPHRDPDDPEIEAMNLKDINKMQANFGANTAILQVPTAKQAWDLARAQGLPFSGETMESFIESFAGTETKRVVDVFRKGYYEGKTNYQMIRELVGTRKRNFKDGLLDIPRHNARTMVRTTMQHASNSGRMATWEQNSDVVEGYQWVSTLDSRTSQQCRSLDGQEFEVGKGPRPPIHPNCRSTTVPVLDPEFDFLLEDTTRASQFGQTSAKQSYYDWLKKQSAGYQNEVLGPTRGKLFRSEGMSAERFRKLNLDKNFQPLTLEEMRDLEPGAFKAAGLDEPGG